MFYLSRIGSIKPRDTIFVPITIFTRAREFYGSSRKHLKSHNHALHDIRIFIGVPLNFPSRVGLLNTIFLLCLTHHKPGIKPGGWIEVYDYSTILCQQP